MKKSKILAPALAILCLSTAASVTGTVAWFAANNVVSATGMNIKSVTPASLVIADTLAHLSNKTTTVSVADASATQLTPATDRGTDEEGLNPEADNDGVLKYVTNGEDVDPATGLALSGETLHLNGVAQSGTHYVDFQTYIASAGDAIGASDAKKLDVTIQNSSAVSADTLMACSVAFFVQAPGSDTIGSYVDTLNLKGYDSEVNDFTTEKTSFTLLLSTGITIPTYAGGTGVRVDMRVYFDGALKKDATHAFVYTNSIDTSELAITATFTLNAI